MDQPGSSSSSGIVIKQEVMLEDDEQPSELDHYSYRSDDEHESCEPPLSAVESLDSEETMDANSPLDREDGDDFEGSQTFVPVLKKKLAAYTSKMNLNDPWHCTMCSHMYKNEKAMIVHIEEHVQNLESSLANNCCCLTCLLSFPSKKELEKHRKTHHRPNVITKKRPIIKPFRCTVISFKEGRMSAVSGNVLWRTREESPDLDGSDTQSIPEDLPPAKQLDEEESGREPDIEQDLPCFAVMKTNAPALAIVKEEVIIEDTEFEEDVCMDPMESSCNAIIKQELIIDDDLELHDYEHLLQEFYYDQPADENQSDTVGDASEFQVEVEVPVPEEAEAVPWPVEEPSGRDHGRLHGDSDAS
ncbi:hypothetical protein quinque_011403 [Culex quinquefasciatus]